MADTTTDGNGNPTTSSQVEPPKLDPKLKVLEDEDLTQETKPWQNIKKDILPVDFLLMTVRDFEFLGCLAFLKGLEKSYHKDLGFIYFGDIADGAKKMKVAVMKSQMGAGTVAGSLISVRNAVPMLRPRAVFYVGICASLKKEKVKLGDVVVCRKLTTFSSIKQTKEGIEDRNVKVPISRKMLSFIQGIGQGWKPPLENSTSLKVKVCKEGVFLSGPEVVNDKSRRAELIKLAKEATAIECEGEGLHVAAHDLNIEWCVIKGVSDYADGKKSETDPWRPFASIMAASLVTHALKRNFNVFESWPHYKGDSHDEDSSTRKRRGSSSSSSSSGSKRNKWTAGGSHTVDAVPEPSTGAEPRTTPPGKIAPTASKALPIKTGEPSDYELETLSRKLGNKWENLARRLGFDQQGEIDAFKEDYTGLANKAFGMLRVWKQKEGKDASYTELYNALCDPLTGCKRLAQEFCLDKSAGNGSL